MSGKVALTFDDGPDRLWTGRLLEELRSWSARATFFVMAPRATTNLDLIETMSADGHEIAFHCTRHRSHVEQGEAELARDLEAGLSELDSVGVRPRAWRTPWGRETPVTRRLAAERELRLWGWNLDTHDWRGDPAEQMHASIGIQGGLRDGDVVLMHDGLGPGATRIDCRETVELTRLLLAEAADQELELAPVSECAGVLA